VGGGFKTEAGQKANSTFWGGGKGGEQCMKESKIAARERSFRPKIITKGREEVRSGELGGGVKGKGSQGQMHKSSDYR